MPLKTLDPITITIIVGFVFNFGVFIIAGYLICRLEQIVRPKSNRRIGMQAKMSISDDEWDKLITFSDWAALAYTGFTNITAVFPLLGILGTVFALMKSSGAENLSANFSTALTTTFLGLICAIFYKLLDSAISSKLDRALDEADYLIHKHDEEKREPYAAQAGEKYHH